LFGDRPISKFAIELANRVLNDFCFNFIDHISPELDIQSRRLTPNEKENKPRQGVVANTLKPFRGGAVGFIAWLGLAMEQWGKLEPVDYQHNNGHDSHYRMRANAPRAKSNRYHQNICGRICLA
jgi:hypothetical protein